MVVKTDDLSNKIQQGTKVRTIKFVESTDVESDKIAVEITMKGKPSAFKVLESRGLIGLPDSEEPPEIQIVLSPQGQQTLAESEKS